jgi:hypothetical protein
MTKMFGPIGHVSASTNHWYTITRSLSVTWLCILRPIGGITVAKQ